MKADFPDGPGRYYAYGGDVGRAKGMILLVARELVPVFRVLLTPMVARELLLLMVGRELLLLARLLVAMPMANLTNDGPCRSPIF